MKYHDPHPPTWTALGAKIIEPLPEKIDTVLAFEKGDHGSPFVDVFDLLRQTIFGKPMYDYMQELVEVPEEFATGGVIVPAGVYLVGEGSSEQVLPAQYISHAPVVDRRGIAPMEATEAYVPLPDGRSISVDGLGSISTVKTSPALRSLFGNLTSPRSKIASDAAVPEVTPEVTAAHQSVCICAKCKPHQYLTADELRDFMLRY